MSKPTIVIVPGAWHSPIHYSPITKHFEGLGYTVQGIALKTAGATSPSISQYDDAEVIRDVIDKVQGKVIVLMHSYGSVPASIAVLGAKNVIGMIFVAAMVVPAGKSIFDMLQGKVEVPWLDLDMEKGTMLCNDPRGTFYQDVEESVAQEAAKSLRPQNIAGHSVPSKDVGWPDFPRAFAITDHDKALPEVFQQAMVDEAPGWLEVKHFDSGHCPWYSKTEDFNHWVEHIVAKFQSSRST